MDCHDWSNIVPTSDGDWQPIANWHVDPMYYSSNLLQNTHMECRDPHGNPGICAPPAYQCNYMWPWNRISQQGSVPILNWGYDSDTQGTTSTYNCALQISTPSAPAGQSLYQDAAVVQGGITTYSYGAALFLPNVPAGQTAQATIAAFELASDGSVVATHNVPAAVSNVPQFYSGQFTLSGQTASVRFQIYPETANVIYELRDAWVAQQPF
jgi:hypothetical protein